MLNQEKIQQFQDLFQAAKSVLVVLPAQPSEDQVAAGLALVTVAEGLGKEAGISSPDLGDLRSEDIQLLDKITTDLGKRDLCIGFDYVPEAVDKVSYNIDESNNRFYLVIKPQKGQPPLSADNVDFRYTGAEADFIILVGVHNFESLNHLYFGYEQLYQSAQVAVLHSFEPEIGTLKLDASGLSSLSEATVQLLQAGGQAVSPEVATNLLTAIETATNGLASLTATAETFETVAWLLRSGAFRKRKINKSLPADGFAAAMQNRSVPDEVETGEVMEEGQAEESTKTSKKVGRPRKTDKDKKDDTKAGGLKYQPNEFSVSSK